MPEPKPEKVEPRAPTPEPEPVPVIQEPEIQVKSAPRQTETEPPAELTVPHQRGRRASVHFKAEDLGLQAPALDPTPPTPPRTSVS